MSCAWMNARQNMRSTPWRSSRRSNSNAAAFLFYQNKNLELYASKEAKRLTLRQLVFYGRSMTEDRLIKNANYVRTELPVRIAHRIRDLQALPYVVVTQEDVGKVYELYWTAFDQFRKFPVVNSMADNTKFCAFLSKMLNDHATVIPSLSLGLSLASPYLPPDSLDSFMRRMLVSRISRRVLAEHHIALSRLPHSADGDEAPVGIIFPSMNVKKSVERCVSLMRKSPSCMDAHIGESSWPDVIVEGQLDIKFRYIREHFEYIVFELLKNAVHATLTAHYPAPPILVTISEGENDVNMRISDQGGGLRTPENHISSPDDLFSFSHTRNASRMEVRRLGALRTMSSKGMRATVEEQLESPALARPRIGIGLPMSSIYVNYFGGSLDLMSLDGWGTDVYLRLPKLGTNLEGIEV